MKDYDTLDELLNMFHSLKVEFNDNDFKQRLDKYATDVKTKDYEGYIISFVAELYKKALVNYLLTDSHMELEYGEASVKIKII